MSAAAAVAKQRKCWCGEASLASFSPDYLECRACGTLVSRVGLTMDEVAVTDDDCDFYGKTYWLGHQTDQLGLPDISQRARADLPERCMHWLRTMLRYKPPPARVLEVGCSHGGFVALLRSLGYDATGLELSPWVVEFARRTFDVPMLLGPVEDQDLPDRSFDAIVLNDVVEHLLEPMATLQRCSSLLKDDGVLVIQMPSYPEGQTYDDLLTRQHRFLLVMDGQSRQHLHLFSRRAAERLFDRLGFPEREFLAPLFDYDMYLVASRQPLMPNGVEQLATPLATSPSGRMTLAWVDLLMRFEVCEEDRAARLKIIHDLQGQVCEGAAAYRRLTTFPGFRTWRQVPRWLLIALRRLGRAA
jgi:2-polyprenyl-3-methyl-5-hydroxy-6-metoxy-1,4-benzoquinol methylase